MKTTKKIPYHILTMQFKITTMKQGKELSKELQKTFATCVSKWTDNLKLPRNWGKVKDPLTGRQFKF